MMTDISKDTVERLAQDCDNFERMSIKGGTVAHLHHDCAATLRALSARIEELEARQVKVVDIIKSVRQQGSSMDESFNDGWVCACNLICELTLREAANGYALRSEPARPVTVQEAAKVLLDTVDDFMSGKNLTEDQRELERTATVAGVFAAAAYDAYTPKSGGEIHALTRAFLLALFDPTHADLDYLRADPKAGQTARDATAALRALSETDQ